MQLSSNVCAVKIWLQVGSVFPELVEKFGITTLNREGDNNDENAAALALGGLSSGVKPIEMAQAYAAIPNGGKPPVLHRIPEGSGSERKSPSDFGIQGDKGIG